MRKCPVCGVQMVRGGNIPSTRSKDHIVPVVWGGRGERSNIRHMCKQCNLFRGIAGHCLGALACARACAGDDPELTRAWLRLWRFPTHQLAFRTMVIPSNRYNSAMDYLLDIMF